MSSFNECSFVFTTEYNSYNVDYFLTFPDNKQAVVYFVLTLAYIWSVAAYAK